MHIFGRIALLLLLGRIGFSQALPVMPNEAFIGAADILARSGGYTLAYGAELGRVESTTTASSYATGAFVIPANAVVYLAISSAVASGSAAYHNALTGHGVTWNLITQTNFNAGLNTLEFYWATTNAATASSALTIGYAADQGACVAWIGSFTGAHLTTPNVQLTAVTNSANISITLSAITGTKNGVLVVDAELDTNGSWGTPEANWTEIDDLGVSNPTCGMYVYYRVPTTDNTIAVTGTGFNASFAVEIGVRQ